jgi:hypothetical protein
MLTIVALLAGAALPPVAAARLRLNVAIAGVSLGDSERAVRARLGPPSTVATQGRSRTLVFADRQLAVTLVRKKVVILTTRNPRERARSGVGMGSTVRVLRRRVPRLRCGETRSFRFCRTGSVKPGRRSTTFLIDGGRVIGVTVAKAVS